MNESQVEPLNVFFLCTHNSARSILAEALLNDLGRGRFKAYSAGSSPSENQQPNPFALRVLRQVGVSTVGLYSKSWDDFSRPDAPKMDLIITVCDNAAGEACPFWSGHPATAHTEKCERSVCSLVEFLALVSVHCGYSDGWTLVGWVWGMDRRGICNIDWCDAYSTKYCW